jgi:CHAD domain-containing protein
VKARAVKVDPNAPLGESLLAIVAVRLDELYSFDPEKAGDLHDMRIAAKRLRYILEIATPVFGEPAVRGMKTMEKLQDLLGEIHDCDELLPLVASHVEKLRAEDVAAAAAGRPLPNRRKYRGLEALRAHAMADRERLYGKFARKWANLQRDAFRARLEVELARAGAPA